MRRGLVAPLVGIGLVLALLLGLGAWQLSRLRWKLDLIARLDTRVHAEPIDIAEVDRRFRLDGDIDYLRLRVSGQFDHELEVHLYSTGPDRWGWQILTPLRLADGGVLLVNRGFVFDAQKDRQSRQAGLPLGTVTVTGLVRIPARLQPNFVPDNEPARNRWYWLDPAVLLMPPRRPYVLEAERIAGPPPNGGVTRLDLPNSHLGYALTWFSLAGALLVMTGSWLYRRRRAGAATAALDEHLRKSKTPQAPGR